jgi:hypothetical protein
MGNILKFLGPFSPNVWVSMRRETMDGQHEADILKFSRPFSKTVQMLTPGTMMNGPHYIERHMRDISTFLGHF